MKTLKLIFIFLLVTSPCFSQTTGGAGSANVWNFPGGTERAGVASIGHLYGTFGFADSSTTVALTTGTYFKITNATDNLFTAGINRGLTIQGDSIQVPTAGDYMIVWDMSGENVNATDEIHIEIFVNNVGQSGKGEAFNESAAATDGISGHTILNIAASGWISLRVKNSTGGNRDWVAEAGNIVVQGLFAN